VAEGDITEQILTEVGDLLGAAGVVGSSAENRVLMFTFTTAATFPVSGLTGWLVGFAAASSNCVLSKLNESWATLTTQAGYKGEIIAYSLNFTLKSRIWIETPPGLGLYVSSSGQGNCVLVFEDSTPELRRPTQPPHRNPHR
jgi:hypothetical protein